MTRRSPPTSLFDQGQGPWDRVDNIGLAYQKLAPLNSDQERDGLAIMIRAIAQRPAPTAYDAGFERWRSRTSPTEPHRRVAIVESQGRVLVGLGERAPSENGLSLHSVYGTPIIPGSSLKGVARAWCARSLQQEEGWAEGGEYMLALFGSGGDEGESGGVDFLDALWVPGSRGPWAAEILTPHQAPYYKDGSNPDGTASPRPVHFLAAEGRFRLAIEGPGRWADLAMRILLRALAEDGVGAKTRVGYGRLQPSAALPRDDVEKTAWDRLRRAWEEEKARADIAGMPAAERLAKLVAHLPGDGSLEDSLRRHLCGKPCQLEAWMALLDWDDEQVLRQVLQQLHAGKKTGGLERQLKELPKGGRRDASLRIFSDLFKRIGSSSEEPAGFGSASLRMDKERKRYAETKRQKKKAKQRAKLVARAAKGGYDRASIEELLAFLEETGAPDAQVSKLRRAYGL